MTKFESEYEKDKQKKKQLLVRNEFLYNCKSTTKHNFPIIKKQNINTAEIDLMSFTDAKLNDDKNKNKTIHFFTYDWKFDKVYNNPENEFEKLKQYRYILSPDFSIFTNMPICLQMFSIFKNRWCGAYWQSKGLKVIPTISWGDKSSFDFCFEGVERGAVVAVCTYYRENCEEEFILGYNEMLKRINPSVVICYDEPFDSMKGNIVKFTPTTFEWTKNLEWKDLVQFKWEKQNKNISGFNVSDFKFFDYDDPYQKDQMTKCPICENAAESDQFGNGECKNCGWRFSKDQEKFENDFGISYPMLVSAKTAKKQYDEGLPFKATFDEFVRGLYFYSEMLFIHKNITYEVFLNKDFRIILCSKDMQQEFNSKEQFESKANIDGRRLKEIWNEVTFAGFMFCS